MGLQGENTAAAITRYYILQTFTSRTLKNKAKEYQSDILKKNTYKKKRKEKSQIRVFWNRVFV
jgi:hypothetical protein